VFRIALLGRSLASRWFFLAPCLSIFAPSAFALAHGVAEDEFNLTVDAAQFGGGPAFQIGPQFGVDSEEKSFAVFSGHEADRARSQGAQLNCTTCRC